MQKYERCVMVCAGDMDVDKIPLGGNNFLIAVDGGYRYCREKKISPDLVIGDFDSLDKSGMEEILKLEQKKPEKVRRLNPVKDDTDTLAAIRIGLNMGCQEFYLYGAMGGRIEHTIANIQCLNFIKESGASGYILGNDTMVTVIKNESLAFPDTMGGMLSVFCMGDQAEGVTESGMKYTLDQAVLTNRYPIGISNELIGENAVLSVENGTLLIIYSGGNILEAMEEEKYL